ncbi:putative ribonuclease H-like domain-containing protein [Tanacetum coccineum]
MALMAFSNSEVYTDKTCSKTSLKNYETLKKQCDDLIVKLNQTEFTTATYKRGLATVEEQLITYRKNEVLFSEEVAVLKREVYMGFLLTTKDETSEILKNFIKEIENILEKKVKIIRSDNGTEFKNKVMDDFCREKGIKREYYVAKTPQQNGVAKRRNRILIEAARTMLADSKLPTTFWAEAVYTLTASIYI